MAIIKTQALIDANKPKDIEVVLPNTDITVSSNKLMMNTPYGYPFTSELPEGTYFMPFRQDGGATQHQLVIIANGAGTLIVNFDRSGTYYIDEQDLDCTITVNGEANSRFTLYVAKP